MIIKHEVFETKGGFVAYEEGKKIGEMTYTNAGPGRIIIDHTEVDPEQKGQGIGKILLDQLVTFVREQDIKVLPLCPFAKVMFEKNVDIRDVLV